MQFEQLPCHQVNLHYKRIGYLRSLLQVVFDHRLDLESVGVFRPGMVDDSDPSQFIGRLRNLQTPRSIYLGLSFDLILVPLRTDRYARLVDLSFIDASIRRAVRVIDIHFNATAVIGINFLMAGLLLLIGIFIPDIVHIFLNCTLLIIYLSAGCLGLHEDIFSILIVSAGRLLSYLVHFALLEFLLLPFWTPKRIIALSILAFLIAVQSAQLLNNLRRQQSLQLLLIKFGSNQRKVYVIYVRILHNIFNQILVLFRHICVDLLHQTSEFDVERLDLFLVYLQEAVFVEEEVFGCVARQPLLLHSAQYLLLSHLLLILLGKIILVFHNDAILYEGLVLLVKHLLVDLIIIEAILVILVLVGISPLDFFDGVLLLQHFGLRKESESIVDQGRVDGGHRKACVFTVKEDREEGADACQALVDLVQSGLYHLKLFSTRLQFVEHLLGRAHASSKIICRRRLIKQFGF